MALRNKHWYCLVCFCMVKQEDIWIYFFFVSTSCGPGITLFWTPDFSFSCRSNYLPVIMNLSLATSFLFWQNVGCYLSWLNAFQNASLCVPILFIVRSLSSNHFYSSFYKRNWKLSWLSSIIDYQIVFKLAEFSFPDHILNISAPSAKYNSGLSVIHNHYPFWYQK